MRTLTERDPVVMNDGTLKQLNEVGGGGESYTLPAATAETLGGVKVGDGLSVEEDGTLSADAESYTLPTATANTLGGVKIGDGVNVAEDGTISVSGGGGDTKYQHNIEFYNSSWGAVSFSYTSTKAEANTSIAEVYLDMETAVGYNKRIPASGYVSSKFMISVSIRQNNPYGMDAWYVNTGYAFGGDVLGSGTLTDYVMEV